MLQTFSVTLQALWEKLVVSGKSLRNCCFPLSGFWSCLGPSSYFVGKSRHWRGWGPSLGQRFSTGVLQKILKHAILGYLVRGIDLFFLKLSNKTMTRANTTVAAQYE